MPNSSDTESLASSQAAPRAQLDWIRRWLPVVVWLCVISWFSTSTFSGQTTSKYIDPLLLWVLPGLGTDEMRVAHFVIRKSAHITEYGILAVLMLRAFRPPLISSWTRAVGSTLAACAVYAFADEMHQFLVPGRTASLRDVAFDFCGAAAGVLIFLARGFIMPLARAKRDAASPESLSDSD